jgi:hypothetical protein
MGNNTQISGLLPNEQLLEILHRQKSPGRSCFDDIA